MAKNKSNAYTLEGSEAEKDAKSRGDWQAALEAFRQTQDEFHETSNRARNASLYVDWVDGEFVAPSERITKEMLARDCGAQRRVSRLCTQWPEDAQTVGEGAGRNAGLALGLRRTGGKTPRRKAGRSNRSDGDIAVALSRRGKAEAEGLGLAPAGEVSAAA